jgi:hypothetical protein
METIIKKLKNTIGRNLHYETCPNCGDSWWWKKPEGIGYKSYSNILFEVVICKECLRNPAGLDLSRIERDLLGLGWNKKDIELARTAIERYKKIQS